LLVNDSVVPVIAKSIDEILERSFIGLSQLEFWTKEKLPEDELLTLTEQPYTLWEEGFPNSKFLIWKNRVKMPINLWK
jgi:hypothetical protein